MGLVFTIPRLHGSVFRAVYSAVDQLRHIRSVLIVLWCVICVLARFSQYTVVIGSNDENAWLFHFFELNYCRMVFRYVIYIYIYIGPT